jgi:hypothetical protein
MKNVKKKFLKNRTKINLIYFGFSDEESGIPQIPIMQH